MRVQRVVTHRIDGELQGAHVETLQHTMSRFTIGDCVRTRDGRIGRVRAVEAGRYRIRVQRKTSKTHQFLMLRAGELSRVKCPSGWMSPDGYRRYLKPTLAKLRQRQRAAKKRKR